MYPVYNYSNKNVKYIGNPKNICTIILGYRIKKMDHISHKIRLQQIKC